MRPRVSAAKCLRPGSEGEAGPSDAEATPPPGVDAVARARGDAPSKVKRRRRRRTPAADDADGAGASDAVAIDVSSASPERKNQRKRQNFSEGNDDVVSAYFLAKNGYEDPSIASPPAHVASAWSPAGESRLLSRRFATPWAESMASAGGGIGASLNGRLRHAADFPGTAKQVVASILGLRSSVKRPAEHQLVPVRQTRADDRAPWESPSSRKQPYVVPYVPPHRKQRHRQEGLWEQEKVDRQQRIAKEDEAGLEGTTSSGPGSEDDAVPSDAEASSSVEDDAGASDEEEAPSDAEAIEVSSASSVCKKRRKRRRRSESDEDPYGCFPSFDTLRDDAVLEQFLGMNSDTPRKAPSVDPSPAEEPSASPPASGSRSRPRRSLAETKGSKSCCPLPGTTPSLPTASASEGSDESGIGGSLGGRMRRAGGFPGIAKRAVASILGFRSSVRGEAGHQQSATSRQTRAHDAASRVSAPLRKQPCVMPYVPPHLKQRRHEEAVRDQQTIEWKRRVVDEGESGLARPALQMRARSEDEAACSGAKATPPPETDSVADANGETSSKVRRRRRQKTVAADDADGAGESDRGATAASSASPVRKKKWKRRRCSESDDDRDPDSWSRRLDKLRDESASAQLSAMEGYSPSEAPSHDASPAEEASASSPRSESRSRPRRSVTPLSESVVIKSRRSLHGTTPSSSAPVSASEDSDEACVGASLIGRLRSASGFSVSDKRAVVSAVGLRSSVKQDAEYQKVVTVPQKRADVAALRTSAPPRKQPSVMPYIPPHLKQRRHEEALWKQEKDEWHKRLALEDEAGVTANVERGPNIRSLAREWESKLELPGTCCFNPLQKDVGVEVDEDGIRASASEGHLGLESRGAAALRRIGLRAPTATTTEPAASAKGLGVKTLPTVARGRYQVEFELLRDCAVVVGWSAATTLPSAFDSQAFGYGPTGALTPGGRSESCEGYGPAFGSAGDIIGAFVEWPVATRGLVAPRGRGVGGKRSGPLISFALNGRSLGVAFDLGTMVGSELPLQPHVCQADGQPFSVLLRGASSAAQLRFPSPRFTALGECLESHFCPFSKAVALATDARLALSLDATHLAAFRLPDSHIVELFWEANSASKRAQLMDDAEFEAHFSRVLGMAAGGPDVAGGCGDDRAATDMLAVWRTGPSTALAAFKLREHATRCIEALAEGGEGVVNSDSKGSGKIARLCRTVTWSNTLGGKPLPCARPLREASSPSRRVLADWRGNDFRAPGQTPTVARRLIHGSLGLQLPLSHLSQERAVERRRVR
eukprot:TRINITY_DN19170_c0_g1_i1.p1 TRINITY_DN19170_c0_g1~~TRINITY_DN19170_c0_g1_i1.p1  ORF type:complete len:1282 (+),score=211.79 TRINITY_DN19170_c0_g1_i1:121-3966(+)